MAWYSAGSVSVTNNSNAVTGTGTDFIANVRVGDGFAGPDGRLYQITNVASATAISISPNYAGSTAGAQAYKIIPIQGYNAESARLMREIIVSWGAQLSNQQPWTYAPTEAAARDALGLGDMSIQEPNAVAITGGTISGISSLGVAGDIAVSGDARRIRGDFSNSTIANRTALQSSVTNGASNVHVLPNGTSQSAMIAVNNNSAPNNSAYAGLSISSTEARIQSGVSGSGSALPLSIWTGSAEAAKVSTAGNFGFGVASPDTSARIQSANGIKVGNTANANPTVLDWYEDGGTSTISVFGGTVSGSATYTRQMGRWTRIGNRLFLQINIAYTGHTGSGQMTFTGIPYVPVSVANNYSSGPFTPILMNPVPGANKLLHVFSNPGISFLSTNLYDTSTGARGNIPIPASFEAIIYIEYEV